MASSDQAAKQSRSPYATGGSPFAPESPWRAYGPDKQLWKENGNYYTKQELHQMDHDPNVSLQCGIASRVLNAD